MGFENRDYYRGGGDDYLSSPAAILGFSIPFGTWFGARVRLHFWLLLQVGFAVASLARPASDLMVAIYIGLLFVILMLHDFGHRVAAVAVGGRHDDFMLWPAGGLSFPEVPPGAWPRFAGFGGGIAVNIIFVLAVEAFFFASRGFLIALPWNPLTALSVNPFPLEPGMATLGDLILLCLLFVNWGLVLVNVLPYHWFDGGFLLDAILTPFVGEHTGANATCIVGMVLAVPMCAFSLVAAQFIALVVWVLLFSSAYARRRQLQSEGTGTLDAAIAASAQGGSSPVRKRKWQQARWAKAAARRAAQARKEQLKIDAILEKVGAKGMQSLTWFEKRTLRKATERQQHGRGEP